MQKKSRYLHGSSTADVAAKLVDVTKYQQRFVSVLDPFLLLTHGEANSNKTSPQ